MNHYDIAYLYRIVCGRNLWRVHICRPKDVNGLQTFEEESVLDIKVR